MNLTVLHLSDIHIQDSSDLILKQANKIASACYTTARNSDACLIIVTGDIAYSGEKNNMKKPIYFYQLLKRKFKKKVVL